MFSFHTVFLLFRRLNIGFKRRCVINFVEIHIGYLFYCLLSCNTSSLDFLCLCHHHVGNGCILFSDVSFGNDAVNVRGYTERGIKVNEELNFCNSYNYHLHEQG